MRRGSAARGSAPAANAAGTVTVTLTATDAHSGVREMGFTLTVGSQRAAPGLYNPVNSSFYFRNTPTAGSAEWSAGFGTPDDNWRPVLVLAWKRDQRSRWVDVHLWGQSRRESDQF